MKVGIFTFYYAYNYGAVLQCLALQRALEQLGLDVQEIDFVPPDVKHAKMWQGLGIRKGLLLKTLPKKYITAMHGREMQHKFADFRCGHFNVSAPYSTLLETGALSEEFDALIVGSDQVWRFLRSPVYFMEFGVPYKGKRISYAPCCGQGGQNHRRIAEIAEWMKRFDHLSVRNDFSHETVRELTGQQVPIVADPTLLSDLSDVQRKVDLPCSDYILTYTLGAEINGGNKKAIESIRRKVGNIPVVAVIPSAHSPHLAPWADIKIWDAGPAEWLYLIAHAKYVYTDSFHGALFSMINHKPFTVYYAEEGRSPRLLDLAKRYEIHDCVVGSFEEADKKEWGCGLDYKKVQLLVDEHVRVSMDYLTRALGLMED